jgi:hypothetical protein
MTRILIAFSTVAALALSLAERPAVAQNGEWGAVKGQVLFVGKPPEPKKVDVGMHAQCLRNGPLFDESWVINPKNQGVRWTFVWLQPVTKDAPALKVHPKLQAIKDKEVSIDQPCCQFEPRALGMREGQVLVAKNSDQIPHNVNYVSFKNESGNVLVPAGGAHRIERLKTDRLPLAIKCDIHPWMRANVRIFNHPYFAVTDADGKFEIKDAPAGKYRLVTWHESGWGQGGPDGIEVTIKGGAATDVKLELKEQK